MAAIHLSSRARCASTALALTPTPVPVAAPGGGGKVTLRGERGPDVPEAREVAGLSTRKNDGIPSLPEFLSLMGDSSLASGRATGRTSSKSMSLTCTVSPSPGPSSWRLSSRDDLARSADREIFDRREVDLPMSEPEAGAGVVPCERASP